MKERNTFPRRLALWSAICLLLATGCDQSGVSDGQAQQQQPQPSLDPESVQSLRESVDALRQEMVALRESLEKEHAQVDALSKAEKDEPDDPGPAARSFLRRAEMRHVDTAALRKIKLPDDPSREQVVEYVKKIADVSRRQHMFNSTDPQSKMLANVGPKHLDVLIENMRKDSLGNWYFTQAIRALASEEHRELIVKSLIEHPALIRIAEAHGWMEDAKPAFIQYLNDLPLDMPSNIIHAIASYRDPTTYEALKWELANGKDPEGTYNAIRSLPGIDLDDAVTAMWTNRGANNQMGPFGPTTAPLAVIAAAHGHLDALDYLVDQMNQQGKKDVHSLGVAWLREMRSYPEIFRILIDYTGKREDMGKWYSQHRTQLIFDNKTKKWKIDPNPLF